MRYRDAGVDIERADSIKRAIAAAVRSTWGEERSALESGFAGVLPWPGGGPRMLAASLDGVGTKLHLALAAGRVSDAAADLVYHGANDLLVHAARPLAFLDYIAQSQLDPEVVREAVEGIARACREVGAVLLGGETAEMPDTYLPGVVDIAGCMLGTVGASELLDGSRVREGDTLLALGSDGLHTNGFSLARRILHASGLGLGDPLPGGAGESVGDSLLAPHRWYGRALWPLLERGEVSALAHITGGGLEGNLRRVLPDGCGARIEGGSWQLPALFRWLIEAGAVPVGDARAAFNLGVGMVAAVPSRTADAVTAELANAGERVWTLGRVTAGERDVSWSGA